MLPGKSRRLVAGLWLAGAVAAPWGLQAGATAAGVDVALRRDGARVVGALQSCVGDRCRFGDATLSVAELAWLGLGVAANDSPPEVDGDGQLAVLANGEVVRGSLGGISLGTVLIGGRSLERREVRWVRCDAAEAVADEAPGAPRSNGEEEEGGEPEPRTEREGADGPGDAADVADAAGDPGVGGAPPAPREPNPNSVRPCPADLPMGGEIDFRYEEMDRIYQRCTGTARMWFRLHPYPTDWPSALGAIWRSDAITYRLVNQGCTDVPDPHGMVCSAPAQPEVRGRVVLGDVGRFGVDLSGSPGGAISFTPIEPQLDFMTLPDEIRHRASTPLQCVGPGGGGVGSWQLPVIGIVAAWGTGDCSSCGAGVCVAPTLCSNATDPTQLRDCFLHPDRYAVVPFTGSRAERCEIGGTETTKRIRWKVCCGCGEPPAGPPPDFGPRPEDSSDDCTDAESLRAGYVGRLLADLESIALVSRELGCARYRSDSSFEGIFGFDGPLGRWSVALGGLAGELAPGQLGTLLGLVAAALDTAQSGSETGALIELSTSDPAVETVLRQLVPAAKAEAVVYLSAHPGDLQGALDAYYRRISANRSRLGGSAKVLSALSQLKDWKEATEGLCASISSWRSWSAETGRLELEHGELKMREREFREKLAAIQARCPELSPIEVQPPASPPPAACPESLPEGDVPCTLGGGERSAAGRSAAGRAGSVTRASFAPPASDGAGPAPDALVRLGALLASAQDRADFEIVPRLAPFMIGAAHDLPLELQRGLLADAVPHLETLRSEVGQAVELGREIERALEQERRSEPPSAAPRAQASLTTSRSMRGSRCGA